MILWRKYCPLSIHLSTTIQLLKVGGSFYFTAPGIVHSVYAQRSHNSVPYPFSHPPASGIFFQGGLVYNVVCSIQVIQQISWRIFCDENQLQGKRFETKPQTLSSNQHRNRQYDRCRNFYHLRPLDERFAEPGGDDFIVDRGRHNCPVRCPQLWRTGGSHPASWR